jgi:predicted polyphosphate/ATP-dependent NAD kinase
LTGTGNDAAAGRWKYVLDAAPIDEIVEALRRRGVVASVWDAAAARPVVEESFRDGETLGEDEVEKISAALIEKAAEALTRVLADAGSMVLLEEWVARRDELLGTEQATGPKF